MRDVRFKALPPVGPHDGQWTHGTLLEFLFALPSVIRLGPSLQPVPPLDVLNDVFKSGRLDAGMSSGCEWKPFEIDATEYRELVDEILTRPGGNFIEDPEMKSRTYKKWVGEAFKKYPPRPPRRG